MQLWKLGHSASALQLRACFSGALVALVRCRGETQLPSKHTAPSMQPGNNPSLEQATKTSRPFSWRVMPPP